MSMQLVIVSGHSGSGKTVALHRLEDLGYFCIDNIPPHLLQILIDESAAKNEPRYEKLAVGIDARAEQQAIMALVTLITEWRQKLHSVDVIFLQCPLDTLITRYSETRRKHPLARTHRSLEEAINDEREILSPIAETADLLIDTSNTTVHELREIIREQIAGRVGDLVLAFQSFAFKHGHPGSADYLFDVRCLPNPYWDTSLRELTGRDERVAQWLSEQPDVQDMFADITAFLTKWLPKLQASNRSYVTVAIGCTGGRHRSVYIAECLAAHFRQSWSNTLVRHPELGDAVPLPELPL